MFSSLRRLACVAALAVAGASVASASAAAPPTVAPVYLSWWANQTTTFVSANGVQTATGVASWQQDQEWNRTAWFGSTGSNMVADFTNQIVYNLDYTGYCDYTCEMDSDTPCNSDLDGDSLCSYDQANRSKYVNSEMRNGVMTDHYYFDDPLGPISMAFHELWVTQGENPVPVSDLISNTPFGTWNSNVTLDYVNFQVGRPPASNFNFTNIEYCYPGSETECQQSRKELHAHVKRCRMSNKKAVATADLTLTQ